MKCPGSACNERHLKGPVLEPSTPGAAGSDSEIGTSASKTMWVRGRDMLTVGQTFARNRRASVYFSINIIRVKRPSQRTTHLLVTTFYERYPVVCKESRYWQNNIPLHVYSHKKTIQYSHSHENVFFFISTLHCWTNLHRGL